MFPQTEFENDIQAIKAYAQMAEGLGYDYLLAYHHVLGAHPNREPKLTGPYTHEHPFHEPMVFFGFLAAITTRLELVTGILILPQRQTVLVAKQTAEVDVLSGGRLRVGIGIGWNYVEYDALGESFQTRGRRVEEQIEVLRKLWTQPLVTHKTAHYVIDNAGINPLPIRRPIPVWFGGATLAPVVGKEFTAPASVVVDRAGDARLYPHRIRPWVVGDLEGRQLVPRLRSGRIADGLTPVLFLRFEYLQALVAEVDVQSIGGRPHTTHRGDAHEEVHGVPPGPAQRKRRARLRNFRGRGARPRGAAVARLNC